MSLISPQVTHSPSPPFSGTGQFLKKFRKNAGDETTVWWSDWIAYSSCEWPRSIELTPIDWQRPAVMAMTWSFGLCEVCFPPKSYTIAGNEVWENKGGRGYVRVWIWNLIDFDSSWWISTALVCNKCRISWLCNSHDSHILYDHHSSTLTNHHLYHVHGYWTMACIVVICTSRVWRSYS